ncbi:hypothetical protein R6Q57_013632 [Mikania cordata]
MEVEYQNSPENSDESPPFPGFDDIKATSTSSPRRSRQRMKKRVVHVPIKEDEGSQIKADTKTPPYDSWAWRKYGQKPIKGSPYPRGYYRCSSSKGCPARKQVERSRTDPTMFVVTYSCDHNHPWPASRNTNHHHRDTPPTTVKPTKSNASDNQLEVEKEEEPFHTMQPEPDSNHEPQQKFTSFDVGACGPIKQSIQTSYKHSHEVGSGGPFTTTTSQYGWFLDLDTTSPTMLERPLMARDMVEDTYDMATISSIRDDEESFFADLGELPECTTVFRQKEVEKAEEHHRNLAPWCGTTG